MKEKSELYPDVTFEKWKTPLSGILYCDLHVGGVLQTCFQVFFFLYEGAKHHKETHVLSIPRDYPYRVMEEEYSYVGVDRYFKYKDPSAIRKKRRSKPCATWKLWSTDMIKEFDAGGALSRYGEIKAKDIIHYTIFTGNDTIEFISPATRWEVHRNMKVEKVIAMYLKKKYREHF